MRSPYACVGVVFIGGLLHMVSFDQAFAQSTERPSFEVASVKANATPMPAGVTGMVYSRPGGRLVAERALLRFLIQSAYRVRRYQVVGGPDWLDSARYDIEGKAASNANPQQLSLMLQSLLEDRFKLKVHREMRDVPIYSMTVTKSGVRMANTKEGSCTAPPQGSAGRPIPPPPAPNSNASRLPVCSEPIVGLTPSGGQIKGNGSSLSGLTMALSNILGRPVIDKAQLNGRYDIQLAFAADESLEGIEIPSPPPGTVIQAADPGLVSIFTALQEQLGLKLESSKGPGEVLVIDAVQKPTEN